MKFYNKHLFYYHYYTHRELRNLSVEKGGMSFKAAPITHKDLFPSRHTAPAPLTGDILNSYSIKSIFFSECMNLSYFFILSIIYLIFHEFSEPKSPVFSTMTHR